MPHAHPSVVRHVPPLCFVSCVSTEQLAFPYYFTARLKTFHDLNKYNSHISAVIHKSASALKIRDWIYTTKWLRSLSRRNGPHTFDSSKIRKPRSNNNDSQSRVLTVPNYSGGKALRVVVILLHASGTLNTSSASCESGSSALSVQGDSFR